MKTRICPVLLGQKKVEKNYQKGFRLPPPPPFLLSKWAFFKAGALVVPLKSKSPFADRALFGVQPSFHFKNATAFDANSMPLELATLANRLTPPLRPF